MVSCLIGIGSNVGNRQFSLETAVEQLTRWSGTKSLQHSRWVDYDAVGGPSEQPRYLNGAIHLETDRPVHDVFARLIELEQSLGRQRLQRWGPRTIDLDLLLYGDEIVHSQPLVVPHPWMAIRPFVLGPAAEIAPQLVHPQIGWTIARLWRHLQSAIPIVSVIGIRCPDEWDCVRRATAACGALWLSPRQSRDDCERSVEMEFDDAPDASQLVRSTWTKESFPPRSSVIVDGWWISDSDIIPSGPPPDLIIHLVPSHQSLDTVMKLQRAGRTDQNSFSRRPMLIIPSVDLDRVEHDICAAVTCMASVSSPNRHPS